MNAVIELLSSVQGYHWLVLGLILLVAELLTGTTYLLWPAAAAAVTGVAGMILPMGWIAEYALFAVLVIALTLFGRPLAQKLRTEIHETLNERGKALIGRRGIVAGAFANGVGSVRIQDSIWRATSEEMLADGAEVEIVSVEGATLSVKRAN